MSLLFSRAGITSIAILIAFALGYGLAARQYNRAAEIEALRAQTVTLRADLNIARTAEASATMAAVTLQEQAEKTQGTIDDLVKEIELRAGRDACRLDESDARRLRDIR